MDTTSPMPTGSVMMPMPLRRQLSGNALANWPSIPKSPHVEELSGLFPEGEEALSLECYQTSPPGEEARVTRQTARAEGGSQKRGPGCGERGRWGRSEQSQTQTAVPKFHASIF